MELPVREHRRADVVEAKNKEIEKLANYDVFEKMKMLSSLQWGPDGP